MMMKEEAGPFIQCYCPNSSSEKSEKEGCPGTTEVDQISAAANQGTAETDGYHQQLASSCPGQCQTKASLDDFDFVKFQERTFLCS